MAYTKTNWVNGSTPAINANNLNKIENELETLDSEATTATENIGDLSELETTAQGSLVEAINEVETKLNSRFSTSETAIGKWSDGKTLYRRIINSTVGAVQDLVNGIGIDKLISANLFARSNYNNYFPIPNNPWNTGANYAIDLFTNASGIRLYFGSFYNSENEVYGYIEYTKANS